MLFRSKERCWFLIKKHILILSILFLLLTACSTKGDNLKVHENVDDTLAHESFNAVNILDKHIIKSKKPDFEKDDEVFLNEYMDRYAKKNLESNLSEGDFQVYYYTASLIAAFGPNSVLDEDGEYINDTKNFKWQKDEVRIAIKKGYKPSQKE